MDSYRDYSVIILIVRDHNETAVVFANYRHTEAPESDNASTST